jgi:tetrapyrrole methylase family protein/MazG family protein
LGPGGPGRLTEATARLLAGPNPVLLRTTRHPGTEAVMAAANYGGSFEDVYQRSDSFDEVYQVIADRLVERAQADGEVVYAVPGSPLVLERSVRHLRGRSDVEVRLEPAVSFLDEVWASLGVDPVDDGVRLIDGHRFATEAAGERGPLLVAHTHAPWVLSDIKLAIDAGPEQRAVVLQRLGTDDEAIFEVAWPDLDRIVEPDHLTSLYLPDVAVPVGRQLARSVEMMHRLRQDCPWDREQSHQSLRKYLLEEACEVLDAIDGLTDAADDEIGERYADLEEELGDLWFQILFHAELAGEAGQFTIAEVAESLVDKMVRRHPHVYGGDDALDGSIPANWDKLKQQEKSRASALDGVPMSLPSLALAEKILKRASSGPAIDLEALAPGLSTVLGAEAGEADVGRLLLGLVEQCRRQGISAELALRQVTVAAADRFRQAERSGTVDDRWVLG